MELRTCRRIGPLALLLFVLTVVPTHAFQPAAVRRHAAVTTRLTTPRGWARRDLLAPESFPARLPSMTRAKDRSSSRLFASSPSSDDIYFNGKTTAALVGGQSVLILIAVALGAFLGVPNKGLGPDICFSAEALRAALVATLPLVGLAAVLDVVEDKVPALQDVTKATQRSVLSLLGGTFKPVLGLLIAFVLGMAAGFGEEMLFRGILQFELVKRLGSSTLAIGLSSLLFGALHAVTPVYALLAGLASVYFGFLYVSSGNLAVPILCHAIYDVGALMYAHWTVSRLDAVEREEIANWPGPSAGP
jgi:membrane protease YdiL (CAAX protease family)